MRQGIAGIALGVSEEGAVKIDTNAHILGPIDPAVKMLGQDLVAVGLAAGFVIAGMEADLLFAGDHRHHFFQIRLYFIRVTGQTRMVAGGLNAAGQAVKATLEAVDIVHLPAMDGYGDLLCSGDGFFHIYTKLSVATVTSCLQCAK